MRRVTWRALLVIAMAIASRSTPPLTASSTFDCGYWCVAVDCPDPQWAVQWCSAVYPGGVSAAACGPSQQCNPSLTQMVCCGDPQ